MSPVTKTSKRAASSAFKISLDNILKTNRKQHAAPKSLTEDDPIAPHLSNPSDIEAPKSDHASDYESETEHARLTAKIETSAGQLAIRRHGLVKCERKVKKIICPMCQEVIYTQKRMNLHMKDKHPTLKFQCGICDEMYGTYNGAYRHTQMHFQLRYKCDLCDHRSQYPGGMAAHMRMHTKKALVPCTSRGCQRKFTSKKRCGNIFSLTRQKHGNANSARKHLTLTVISVNKLEDYTAQVGECYVDIFVNGRI